MKNTQLSILLCKKFEIFSSLSGFYNSAFEFVFVEPSDLPKARGALFTPAVIILLHSMLHFLSGRLTTGDFPIALYQPKQGFLFRSLSCVFPVFVLYFL